MNGAGKQKQLITIILMTAGFSVIRFVCLAVQNVRAQREVTVTQAAPRSDEPVNFRILEFHRRTMERRKSKC